MPLLPDNSPKQRSIIIGAALLVVFTLSCNENPTKRALPHNGNPFGIEPQTVKIAAVGDMMFARGVALHMDSAGFDAPLRDVAEYLAEFDITTGNLECPVSEFGAPMDKKYVFRADPAIIPHLVNAGFDVLTVANNHAFDYGLKCFCDGLVRLENGGIETVGGGVNLDEALKVRIVDARGIKFGLLGFNDTKTNYIGKDRPACAPAYEPWVFDAIRNARDRCDVLIVQIHWGEEYRLFPTERQIELGRAMIDRGVDVILGHHPHSWQGIEFYGGGLIAYSLGNFVFDQNDMMNNLTGILEMTFRGNELIDARIRPIELLNSPKEAHFAHFPEDEIFFGYLTESLLFTDTEITRESEKFVLSPIGR